MIKCVAVDNIDTLGRVQRTNAKIPSAVNVSTPRKGASEKRGLAFELSMAPQLIFSPTGATGSCEGVCFGHAPKKGRYLKQHKPDRTGSHLPGIPEGRYSPLPVTVKLASVGLEELNSARHSLGTLIAVKCKESKNRLADGQAFLMNVDDTSVLSSRSMDSKEVIIMCDKYTASPVRRRAVGDR